MKNVNITHTADGKSGSFSAPPSVPGILVGYAPEGSVSLDRYIVSAKFTVGRDPLSDLPLIDDRVSKKHLSITRDDGEFRITDLGSKNGTFVEGQAIAPHEKCPLQSPALIRVGRAVLVFHSNSKVLLERPPAERFGMAGAFHSGPLIEEFR